MAFGLLGISLLNTRAGSFQLDLFVPIIMWTWAPVKVGFFVGEVSWGGILTLEQLKRRRGWILPNRCCLCKGKEESTNSFWGGMGYGLCC